MRSPTLFALLALLAAPLMAQSPAPAPAAAAAKLGSRVFVFDELKAKPTAVGEVRAVVDLPSATFEKFESHITTLNPGQGSHAPHKHAREEFIIIQEGTLEVHINGQTQVASPGSVLFYASNDMHAVKNIGATRATYLVFNFETVATRSTAPEGAAVAKLPGKLASQVFHWEKLVATPTKVGARRTVVASPTPTCENLSIHVTTLNAGEIPHGSHRHPDEEIVVVKEGVMECTIEGVTRRGGPGSIFFYGSNNEHGMKNVGGTTASYYVIRIITTATPKPPAKK